ncbi:MAG: flagellar M-ring protein FliF, partial [Pseudomonadota bacterium]
LSVLLVLLLGVRPLIKAFKREPAKVEDDGKAKKKKRKKGEAADADADAEIEAEAPAMTSENLAEALQPAQDPETGVVDAEALARQVSLAQRLVVEKPENALVALKQMLNNPENEEAAA